MNSTAAVGVTLGRIIRRDRVVLIASAFVVGSAAWLFLLTVHHPGAHGASVWQPHWQSWGWTAYAWTVAVWMVMMVAMMLPAVVPWALFFARSNRLADGPGREADVSVLSFLSGYFVIWFLYSLAAAGVQLSLQHVAASRPIDDAVATAGSGLVLVLAGAFQLTELKQACLRHCRSPLGFFLTRWQDGPAGAARMGFRHGVVCLGCCWALMAVALALGAANLAWMVALTAVICVETLLPHGDRVGRGIGVVLIAWGTTLALLAALV
ncbi:MAG: DUF2182 domain-containing protein [Gemmatimonadetes bacterium]|nr:DUF2182 domain-containing protein [Gemmatimonadota bacterium]